MAEPEATGVEVPMPWSMKKATAFCVVHESSDVPPGATDVGLAESEQTSSGGGGVSVTATVAVQVAVPPSPVTVPV